MDFRQFSMIFRIQKSDENLKDFSCCFFPFCSDVGSILDTTGNPKIEHFSLIFTLGATLGPSWRQEGAQSAPRRLQSSIFQEISAILESIFEGFRKISKLIFYTIPYWISKSMF